MPKAPCASKPKARTLALNEHLCVFSQRMQKHMGIPERIVLRSVAVLMPKIPWLSKLSNCTR